MIVEYESPTGITWAIHVEGEHELPEALEALEVFEAVEQARAGGTCLTTIKEMTGKAG